MTPSNPARLFVTTFLGLGVLACSSGDAPQPGASAAATSTAAASAMSPDAELDALLRGLADCKLDAKGFVDATCAGAGALRDWAGRHKAWLDEEHRVEAAAVGARYVKNPSAAVRIESWHLVARRVKDDPALQALLAETAKTEKDAPVLVGVAEAAGRAPEVPALRELLVGLLAHEDESVRKRAVESLVPTNAPPPAGVRASLLSALKGASMDVRKKICQRLRVGDDPELFGAVSKLLDTTNTPATLYDDCFYGLVLSWLSPEVTTPSRDAYERTLTCLEKCKRNDERIGLGVSFMNLVVNPKPDAKKLPAFVDPKRVEAALIAIIKDDKAQGSLRFSAAMNFDDLEVAAKRSGLTAKALAELGAKAADPAKN